MLREFFFTLKVFFCKNEKAKNWRIKKCFLPLFFNNGGRKKAVILKALFVGRNHEKERVFVFKLGLVEELPIWWAFTHIVEISSLPLFFICCIQLRSRRFWSLPIESFHWILISSPNKSTVSNCQIYRRQLDSKNANHWLKSSLVTLRRIHIRWVFNHGLLQNWIVEGNNIFRSAMCSSNWSLLLELYLASIGGGRKYFLKGAKKSSMREELNKKNKVIASHNSKEWSILTVF